MTTVSTVRVPRTAVVCMEIAGTPNRVPYEVKLVCRSYQLILRSSASLLAHATPQCFYFRPVCLAVYFGLCSMLGKCIPREPV